LLSPLLTGYDYVIASGYRLLAHRTYPAISTQCQNKTGHCRRNYR